MNKKFYILREIAENKKLNREKVCHTYNISHSELDKYLMQLKSDDEFLMYDDNINYEELSDKIITDKGFKYLNDNKVETAIILASGLGSRMGELTANTSKCLLNVKGDILIERLICQLKEKGIENIVVLIGYLKEKFMYLKDKYGIKLVENPEYDTKNTIGSFYHLIDELQNKNSYIIVGDIYLEENIFNKYEVEPYYLGPWLDDCTGEWIYNYDKNCKVSGVVLDGFYDYFLGGFSFHTKHFINELIKLVKEKYHEKGTENLYWEEVLVYNFDKLPDFYVRKINDGILYEFDTQNDLKRIKDETIILKEQVREILNLDTNDEIVLKRLNDGINNHTYLLNVKDKKYVVRIPGVTTGVFIDRKKEKEIYQILDKHNISDKVVYFDDTTGLKITKYIDTSVDISQFSVNEYKILAYKKLHCLNLKVNKDISITKILNDYISIMHKHKISFIYDDKESFESIYDKCLKIKKYIDKFNRPKVLCHGDAGYSNVLICGDDAKIIDFEFAGMSDPITDIALFAVYSSLSIDEAIKLLDTYKNVKIKNDEILELNKNSHDELINLLVSYMAIDAVACVIWNLIHTTVSGKYIDKYSASRLMMFDNCYKYLSGCV